MDGAVGNDDGGTGNLRKSGAFISQVVNDNSLRSWPCRPIVRSAAPPMSVIDEALYK